MKLGEKKQRVIPEEDVQRMDKFQIEFGEYLRELRYAKNLSTRKVGELIDVSSNYISRVERGQKQGGDQFLIELAEVYDVPPEEILARGCRIDHKMQLLLMDHPLAYDLFREIAHDDMPLSLKEELFKEIKELYEQKKKKQIKFEASKK